MGATAGFLIAALVCGGLVAALAALAREIRGIPDGPGRQAGAVDRLAGWVRSPVVWGRAGGAVLAGVATLIVTRWPVAAAAAMLMVMFWPRLFGGARAEQQQMVQLEALVTFTESLRDTIAAHASLEQALPAAAGNAPLVLRPALIRLCGRLQARIPLDQALESLAAELDDPSADLVIAALILNVRRRGDRLGEVLTGLAIAAREELEMRRKISAGRVDIRRSVRLVVIITIVMAVGLAIFTRAFVAPYSTPAGQVMLACICGIFGVGFWWLRSLAQAPAVAPFLARADQSLDPVEATLIRDLTRTNTVNPQARSDQR